MPFVNKGVHLRKISGLTNCCLIGDNGLIDSLDFHTEIKTTRETLVLGHPAFPSLGVVIDGEGATLAWDGHTPRLDRWTWFYLPAGATAALDPGQNALSLLLTQPRRLDPTLRDAAFKGEPVVAPLEMLRVFQKEGRVTYNAAGDGCPIDRPTFMASFCIYDQAFGRMPQHVHTDQEECMLVLRATGSQPTFSFSSHTAELQDETLIHVFPGDYHGFSPAADGKIAIIALYLVPASNAGIKLEPMSPEDITSWQTAAGEAIVQV